MIPRRNKFNSKREILSAEGLTVERQRLDDLAHRVVYGGNPEHKRNPGDFGLTPPSGARTAKTLCDSVGIFSRKEATELLRAGLRQGMVSSQTVNGWPKNIWAVADNGTPVEAQLENHGLGTYHGYPMPMGDKFREEVLGRWKRL